MKRSIILLAFVAAGALATAPAFAKQSGKSEPRSRPSSSSGGQNMQCLHYMAMNDAGQTATVNSMRSRMPAANRMPSSHQMAKKVAVSCKDHPGMMVHEVMEKVMPLTSVMPH